MAPMRKPTRSLKEQIDNIAPYGTHGIHRKIMSIKRRARGYRNIENLKTSLFSLRVD